MKATAKAAMQVRAMLMARGILAASAQPSSEIIIQDMRGVNIPSGSNRSSQAGRRRRNKRAMSNAGRTSARIR